MRAAAPRLGTGGLQLGVPAAAVGQAGEGVLLAEPLELGEEHAGAPLLLLEPHAAPPAPARSAGSGARGPRARRARRWRGRSRRWPGPGPADRPASGGRRPRAPARWPAPGPPSTGGGRRARSRSRTARRRGRGRRARPRRPAGSSRRPRPGRRRGSRRRAAPGGGGRPGEQHSSQVANAMGTSAIRRTTRKDGASSGSRSTSKPDHGGKDHEGGSGHDQGGRAPLPGRSPRPPSRVRRRLQRPPPRRGAGRVRDHGDRRATPVPIGIPAATPEPAPAGRPLRVTCGFPRPPRVLVSRCGGRSRS